MSGRNLGAVILVLPLIAGLAISWATVEEPPPEPPPPIEDNPGVPGLLARIAELEAQLAEAQARIAGLEAELAAKDAQIAALEAEIAAKDEQIAGLEAEIAAKDEQIAAKDEQIADLEAEVAAQDEEIADLEEEIAAKDDQIADLEDRVAFLESHASVLRTGQTECWDQSGNSVSCTGTGQDGELQLGLALPDPRFTDNLNGTVTDNLTGLVWLQDANCFDRMSWQEALDTAAGLQDGDCGLTDGSLPGDWRLPNVRELQSLVDFSQWNYSIDEFAPFSYGGTQVWSSTTVQSGPAHAWYLHFGDGGTNQDFDDPDATLLGGDNKVSFPGVVWPVRDSQL
jgi:hypothetical protein